MANTSAAQTFELNLEEYWHLIVRRRWVIIFSALALGFFSWLFAWLHQPPPMYSSSAQVKVEQQTDLAEILLGRGGTYGYQNLNTYISLARSYAVMKRAAEKLGLIPKGLTDEEIRSNEDYLDAIEGLRDAISVEREGDTNILTITAIAARPEAARDMAQAVADALIAYNIEDKNRRVFEAKRFIERQLKLVAERLREAEEAVQRYREEHGLSTLSVAGDIASKVIADLEQQYRQESARLNAISFALAQLKARLKGRWSYRAVTVGAEVSPYFDELNKKLMELALKHTQLSTMLTEAHPEMRELRAQAADILRAMVDELEKQVRLSKQRLHDIQMAIETNERRFLGAPEEALELQRLERTVRLNEELYDMLEKRYQEILIREAQKIQEISLLRPAMVSPVRINPPRTGQVAAAGLILGLVLGLIIALILEALDTSIGTIEEVEEYLGAPVVGFLPHFSRDEAVELFSGIEGLATRGSRLERQMRLVSHFAPRSTLAESYRSLRTNLMFALGGKHKAFLVTSATAKEGKSTVAANLAIVFAQQGARVLLVDADLRKPIQHHQFGVERAPGLAEALLGQLPWRRALKRFSDVMLGHMGVDAALMTPGLDQLDLLPAGEANVNPPDLLASDAMDRLLTEARKEYDYVIVDVAPMLHTSDAAILAPRTDGVVLVYYIGSVVRAALRRVKQTIESVGGRTIGVVINGVHGEASPDYARYKMDRYYDYAYGEEATRWGRIQRRLRRSWQKARTWLEQLARRRAKV